MIPQQPDTDDINVKIRQGVFFEKDTDFVDEGYLKRLLMSVPDPKTHIVYCTHVARELLVELLALYDPELENEKKADQNIIMFLWSPKFGYTGWNSVFSRSNIAQLIDCLDNGGKVWALTWSDN